MTAPYFVTSREGLYYVIKEDMNIKLIMPGKFFGIGHHNQRWYVFQSLRHQHEPSQAGIIVSFRWDAENQQADDLRTEAEGLDNGSHQLIIYKDKLYLLETYIQQIHVYTITDDGRLVDDSVFHPTSATNIINANYLCWKDDSPFDKTKYTCHGYLHMNALSVQDGYLYIGCAHLRNAICNDKPSHYHQPYTIMVFDMNTHQCLAKHTLDTEVACHDLVFLGMHAYLTSPPNKVVRYNIVTRTTETVTTFPFKHPRGLSILLDNTMAVGFRDGHIVVSGDAIMLPRGVAPCCVCSLDPTIDFYFPDSPLRAPFVIQLATLPMSVDTNPLIPIANDIFSQHAQDAWSMTTNMHNANKRFTSRAYGLKDILDPPASLFATYNLKTYQATQRGKIAIEHAWDTPGHAPIWQAFQKWRRTVEVSHPGVQLTGRLYLYPPDHQLGWHTNLETSINNSSFRCYIVYTSNGSVDLLSDTYFMYRHPVSKQIHAVPDRHTYCNVFFLGSPASPMWHAVINPSSTTHRLSVGLSFTLQHVTDTAMQSTLMSIQHDKMR